jgi:Ino eighty subunit 2
LKREETARKRKNLSEKKLEDEKVRFYILSSIPYIPSFTVFQAETINRLLKKQSRPRNKRNALSTAEDRTPQEGEVMEESVEIPQVQVVPNMYRWISTTRTLPVVESDMQTDGPTKTMALSFSVPLVALP